MTALVTIHLAPGQTPQQLIRLIQRLNGNAQVRTVSGRFGVLVDAELAYRYLADQFGPPEPPPAPAKPAAAESKPKPKAVKAVKAVPKAAKVAADSIEEV